MKGGVKFLGHSVHPMLIVFPFGLLAAGMIFDVVFYFLREPTLAVASYWMLAAGIVGGLAAALFGWLDWAAIPADTRAKRIGLIHGLTNMTAVAVFALSWYLRMNTFDRPPNMAIVLSVVGAIIALGGGWLGGELVERLGIGVHEGAHPDAPSSLSTDSPLAAGGKR